jgi:hypothetical protein
MDKNKAREILKDTLAKAHSKPGLVDSAKFIALKNDLERCDRPNEVINLLFMNRKLIFRYLSETDYNACIEAIRLL